MIKKLLLFGLAAVLLLASCSPIAAPTSGEQASAQREVVISRAITSEPAGLDPHGAAGAGQNVILPYLFDTLIYRAEDNSYQPYLAERWNVSDDGTQITFYLRQGITFHDGTPLDAEAVKFNFERFREVGARSPMLGTIAAIERIEVVDPLTIRFTFPQPTTTFLSSLTTAYAGIVSPKAVEESGDGFGQEPVGSGAFILDEWEPGVSITLVKNPNYAWAPPVVKQQGAPNPDQLVFKVIPDASSQLTAFQANELDILFINSPGHVAALQNDPNATLIETTLNSLIYLGFQCQKAPFDDVRVRQAFSYAVNKEELLQTALGGIGEVAISPLASTLPGFDPSVKEYELGYDPEKTKELLQEAGFEQQGDGSWIKDGQPLEVTLLTSTRPPNPSLATVLQAQFKAVGIPVDVQQLDSTAAMESATQGNFDLLLWRYDWNDADVLSVYLSSERIGRTNRNFYSNSELDAILEQAAHELDESTRNALYRDAQRIILQDAPWQPLYVPQDYIVIRKQVNDVVVGSMGRLMLNDVTKDSE